MRNAASVKIRAVVRSTSAVVCVAVVIAGAACDSRAPGPRFTEITADLGLDATPAEWPDGRYRIPEISVGGVGLFDFDGDGDLDLYQVRYPPPGDPDAPAPNRLLEFDGGAFRDISAKAGLADPGYGNGVAMGDIDNDGDVDVFVANVGQDALYRNNGDGTFENITAGSGVRGDSWSTCAAFFDYDRDGDLDLYVSRYAVDDPARVCRLTSADRRDYCGPMRYPGVPDTLYRNESGGRFTDVSATAGLTQARRGFGVVCVDVTGDDWIDICVANDMQANQLYVNQRNGTFVEQAHERGLALNGAGRPEAGMGVAIGDVDGNGSLDLAMTHLFDQTNTLYLNGAGGELGRFSDRSARSGVGAPSLPFTAWGCVLADFDHDGDLDLATVNGRVARGAVLPNASCGAFWNEYAEPNQLYTNDGKGVFVDVSAGVGSFASTVEVSRGLASGDIDGDGDVDLVVANIGEGLRVYRNDSPPAGTHWLRVRALTRDGRDALGAIVTARIVNSQFGSRGIVRPILGAGSFASASEPVAHFGLGRATSVDRLDVVWPDGTRQRVAVDRVDRTIVVRQ